MKNEKVTKIIVGAIIGLMVIVLVAFLIFAFSKSKNNSKEGKVTKVDESAVSEELAKDLKNNEFDKALSEIDKLLTKNPSDIDLLLMKAETLLTKGSAQFKEQEYAIKAQKIIDDVLKIDKNNAEAYRLLGYSYEIQNMFDEALTNYNTALTFKETADTYNWIGHTYELKGEVDVAEKFYEKAYKMDKNNQTVMRNLVRIYANTNKKAEARKLLEQLIKMPVDNISAVAGDYHSLGVLNFDEQKIDEARANFKKALTIDPSLMLAQVEIEKIKILFDGKLEEAINQLNKISQNYPKQVMPVEWLGFAYLNSDKINEAMTYFEKALAMLPEDITLMPQQRTIIGSRLHYYLSIVYSLNNEVEKGKDHLLRSMEGMDDATMTMLINSLEKGENGPYKNIMQDQEVVKLINQLNNK